MAHQLRILARLYLSLLASVAFLAAMAGLAFLADASAFLVYAVSFWHYYLYGLAYTFGAVHLDTFKRDAVLMKGVALLAFGTVYLAAPLEPLSLALVMGGFLLNALAARALGTDRTYYGYEVADLPPRRVTAFPYSWVAHPMLVGNMLAFGGTLLNAEFREWWWPLAGSHVALNLGLLLMEKCVTPQRRRSRHPDSVSASSRPVWLTLGAGIVITALGAACGAAVAGITAAFAPRSAAQGAVIAAYAYVLFRLYAEPRSVPQHQPDMCGEVTP